jgi:hypothetical protein
VGFRYLPVSENGKLSVDANLRGYFGKRHGLAGSVMLNYKF